MKAKKYSKTLIKFARENRHKQTHGEKFLWSKLRNNQFMGIKFRRQVPIDKFIADFHAAEIKLIIEVDGASHDEEKYDYDRWRESKLESFGFKIIRFTEHDVCYNLNEVLISLEHFIREQTIFNGTVVGRFSL